MLARNETAPPDEETVLTNAGLIRLVRYLLSHADDPALASLPWDRLCRYVELCEAGSLVEAHVCGDSKHSRCGIHIAVRFSHNPNPPRQATTNPRLFDPLFFAALLLFELAGIRFTFHYCGVDATDRYYLRVSRKGSRPYVARIVCDALSGRRAMMENDHHSYCLADLIQGAPDHRLASPRLGRTDAIESACQRFEKRRPHGLEGMSPADFRALLTEVLDAATRVHGGGFDQ